MATSLNELDKALASLNEAILFADSIKNNDVQFRIARDACIQRFEYSIELTWKISMKCLGSQTKFAKPAIREMARANLIQNVDLWFGYVEARNQTSHSYDEDTAVKIYSQIRSFFIEALKLLTELEKNQ